MSRLVTCIKLKQNIEGLSSPPFSGELGDRIFQQVSKQAWTMWLSHQTMLINEYRLSMIDPKAREFLQQEMEKFFFGEGSRPPAGYVNN
ncbi:MAG: oxidative damage protection protein [Legionella sp.]